MDGAASQTSTDRLSRIMTMWTVVRAAHSESADQAVAAQHRLVQRYSGAVHAYLLGAVRQEDVADELFQEFALRVVRGDFFRANPEKGRFRDYLRQSLIYLVNDHHRARKAWHPQVEIDKIQPVAPTDDDEQNFVSNWRQELLDRTWQTLEETLPTYHAVLLFRIENPDVPSPQMAEHISQSLGKPMSAESIRKTLQRAHEKYADLLLEEVETSLVDPNPDDLAGELEALDLKKYCRPALERRLARQAKAT